MAFYVLCDDNCKYEGMTKEDILSVIAQAAAGGLVFDTDAAFITKVQAQNGGYVTFWKGTQAQFNALTETDPNCLYVITDATCFTDLEKAIEKKQNALDWVTDEDIDAMFAGTYTGSEDETNVE